MCEYMTMTLSGIPVCKDGKLCTLCVVGNKDKYNKLNDKEKKSK